MPEPIDEVQAHVRRMSAELDAMAWRMIGLVAALPPSPAEVSASDLDGDLDPTAGMRSALLGGLYDHLRPLRRVLLSAASYRPGAPEPAGADPFDMLVDSWAESVARPATEIRPEPAAPAPGPGTGEAGGRE